MSDLLVERRGAILQITFNRPDKKNAVTPEIVVRLAEAWKRLRDDAELRVAILTGVGDAFCAGADLGRLIPLLSKARLPEDEFDHALVADRSIFQTAFLRRFEIWKPIIAAVNGFALAGGMELLQATDIRLATPEARFGLSEPKRGIIPGGGSTVRLARQQLMEITAGLREELNELNGRVKNLKSQIARIRNSEAARLTEIREQLGTGEARAEELRKEILRREKQRIDERELRRTMQSFEDVWKALNIDEQRNLLRQLVEKIGYDGRVGKVTVSFKSAAVKELVQKEAVR